MEQEQVVIGSNITSSWTAVEGSLVQSVKVVEESEDAVYTAEPTSKLVLVPPSPSSSSSSEEEASANEHPCELTVTFQKRLGHIHQIYVLCTARICEIYGVKDQNGDRDYVCTVRGGIISFTDDDDSADDAFDTLLDAPGVQNFTVADSISNTTSLVPSSIPELDPATEVPRQMSQSELQSAELCTKAKMDSLLPVESPSLSKRHSKGVLFNSFTEAINGWVVDRIIEESLDHADWVECPHSPMKSTSSTSDDEAEVVNTKSGFYFIDADVEPQQVDYSQVRLFVNVGDDAGKNSTSHFVKTGDTRSSGQASWQETSEELLSLTSEMKSEESCKSLHAQVDEYVDDFIGKSLTGSGLFVYEVNEEHDTSSSAIDNAITGKATVDPHDDSTQVAETSRLERKVQRKEDMESRYSVAAPVYECEVNLFDADAWTSVTIRLLSIKAKRQVEIYRVVVTYTPGPPVWAPIAPSMGPFQQGFETSSFMAMLVPGIFQMARGMSETRIAKISSMPGSERGLSVWMASKIVNDNSSLLSQNVPTVDDTAPCSITMNKLHVLPTADKNVNFEVKEKAPSQEDPAESTCCRTSFVGSTAVQETQGSIGHGGGLSECVRLRSQVDRGKGSKQFEQSVHKESGLLETHPNIDRVNELVQQRLDGLETVCLQMESSLNAALKNIDKRLEFLESGGTGRMPAGLGQPIWGPVVDSGSFVSGFTGNGVPGTSSFMESEMPFSLPSAAVHVPVGEFFTKGVTSIDTSGCPTVLSSTFCPSLSSVLPPWALSSWPQTLSHCSNSHSFGPTASFISKSGFINWSDGSLRDSEHPSNGGDTYWGSQTSDESESDISSDLEETSYADNCEDPRCECRPESMSSSSTKSAKLVDNALASALSAFSASFGSQSKAVCTKDQDGEMGRDKEDGFTSEDQVPLVELDSFLSYFQKVGVGQSDAENVFMHGYEPIPLCNDKDNGDLSNSKGILEDIFWSYEVEGNKQNCQDEGIQTQDENLFFALEDCDKRTREDNRAFETSSAVLIYVSDHLPPDSTAQNTSSASLDRVPQRNAVEETEDEAGAVLDAHEQDSVQNPSMQGLVAGDGRVQGSLSAWHHEGLARQQGEIVKNVLSSYFQEGSIPDEWNWFASEVSSSSSLMEVRDSSEDDGGGKGPADVGLELMNMLYEFSSEASPSQRRPWSSLDDDAAIPRTTEQFGSDMHGQEWRWQNVQCSPVDEFPPNLISGDKHLEADSLSDTCGKKEQRSLLDEDITLPSVTVLNVEQHVHRFCEDPLDLTDMT